MTRVTPRETRVGRESSSLKHGRHRLLKQDDTPHSTHSADRCYSSNEIPTHQNTTTLSTSHMLLSSHLQRSHDEDETEANRCNTITRSIDFGIVIVNMSEILETS